MQLMPFGGWITKRASAVALRAEVREECFFLSRKEAGMSESWVRETRKIDLPKRVAIATERMLSEWEIAGRVVMCKLPLFTWQAQLAGGRFPDASLHHDGKINEIVDLLKGELRKEVVVVWTRFRAEIDALATRLRKESVPVVALHGDTDKAERVRTIRSFALNCKPTKRVLIAQQLCVQTGVDLSAASTEIYMSNYPDLDVRAQSSQRIYHPAKREPLLLIDIVARNTLDEDLVDALADKGATAASFHRAFMDAALARASKAKSTYSNNPKPQTKSGRS